MARSGAGRRRSRRWAIGLAALLVVGLATGAGVLVAHEGAAADPVLTAIAARQDVTRSVTGTGTLVDETTYAVAADGTATVVPQSGGTAASAGQAAAGTTTTRSVAVQPGQRVTRGQRLARVQVPGGAVRDVDSPVAGRVRTVTAAARATAGEVATIGSGRVLAALAISENRIGQVRQGQTVAVVLAAGTATTTGAVDSIEQVPDSSSGALRYTVLVRLDRVPAGARIGMSATGVITTDRVAGVVAVPAAAIEVRGRALRAQVEDADGVVRTLPVRIGLVGDTAVQVVSGLRAGQRVVVGTEGEVAASTSRLGPPAAVTGSTPSSSDPTTTATP